MRKLLTILGAVGLITTTGTTVVACGDVETNQGDFSIKTDEDQTSIGIDQQIIITIEDYQNLQTNWSDFSLSVTNSDEESEPVLTIINNTPDDQGQFIVQGSVVGKSTVVVNAKSIVNGEADKFSNTITIKVVAETNLILKSRALSGKFDSSPSQDEVLTKVKDEFGDDYLDWDEVNLTLVYLPVGRTKYVGTLNATPKTGSQKYSGVAEFGYGIKKPLSEGIEESNRDLGVINVSDLVQTPSAQQIIDALTSKIDSSTTDTTHVEVTDITDISATITATSDNEDFIDSVSVTFTTVHSED